MEKRFEIKHKDGKDFILKQRRIKNWEYIWETMQVGDRFRFQAEKCEILEIHPNYVLCRFVPEIGPAGTVVIKEI